MFIKIYRKILSFLKKVGLSKVLFLKKIHSSVKARIMERPIDVGGNKMYLDSEDSLSLFGNGEYESFETNIVKKEVKEGDIVLDIGGMIGYYSIIFSKLVGGGGKVFIFEPEIDNLKILKKNVELNNCSNVDIVEKAVTRENQKIKLYLEENNKGMHSTTAEYGGDEYVEVAGIKLDNYFNDDQKIDIIKIDIEGGEMNALEGMKNLIARNNIKLFIEFPRDEFETYFVALKNLGFSVNLINEKTKELILCEQLSEDIFKIIKEDNVANLFCVK